MRAEEGREHLFREYLHSADGLVKAATWERDDLVVIYWVYLKDELLHVEVCCGAFHGVRS